MIYLVIATFIWSFSFGLTKGQLSNVSSDTVTLIRIGLSFIIFLPFLRIKNISLKTAIQLICIGSIQFGVMYLFYHEAFRHLKAYEVALFTITTPIYVTIISNLIEKKSILKYIVMRLGRSRLY